MPKYSSTKSKNAKKTVLRGKKRTSKPKKGMIGKTLTAIQKRRQRLKNI